MYNLILTLIDKERDGAVVDRYVQNKRTYAYHTHVFYVEHVYLQYVYGYIYYMQFYFDID
jgi:hypothetical protein